MYKNLKEEMVRKGITTKDMAAILGLRYRTIANKLGGKYEFKLKEALAIKKEIFPNLNIEYLFRRDHER